MPLSEEALAPRKLIWVCGIAAGVPRRGEITTPAAPAGAHAIEQQVPVTARNRAAAVRVRGFIEPPGAMDGACLIAAARVILSGSQSKSTAMGAKLRAGALRERLDLVSDFTIANLMELENVGAQRTVQVDARLARAHIDSEHLGVSYFRYEPGYRSQTGHSHAEQEEAYVVIGGSGRVKLDEEVRELRRWDVVRVAPRVVRAFEAGPEGLELIVVGSDRPEGGDGTMVSDWWTDH